MKVLITGWNQWIWLSCTQKFVQHWHEVVVLARQAHQWMIHENVRNIDFDLLWYADLDLKSLNIDDCDILINNAWMMHGVWYDAYTDDMRDNIMKLNVEVPVYLISQLAYTLQSVVSIWSIAWHIWHKDIRYGISKAAIHNLTKSFAKQLGPNWVKVNCVAPGPVNTDMLATIPESRKEWLKKAAITNRFAEPKEVADTIYRLACEAPDYINGICVDIKNWMHFRA